MYSRETKAIVKTVATKCMEIIGGYYDRNNWDDDPIGQHYGVSWMQGDWHDDDTKIDAKQTWARVTSMTDRIYNFSAILEAIVKDERGYPVTWAGVDMEIACFVYREIEFDAHDENDYLEALNTHGY